MLTEYVRQALGRSISNKYLDNGKSAVITLDPELEKIIMDSIQRTESGSYLALEPGIADNIINSVSKQIQRFVEIGQQPIILTAPVVRLYFKRLTEHVIPNLIVLSYNELDSKLEVQSIGMVSV